MTSRLTLRSSAPHGGKPWELDAVPAAYEEAARQQFKAFPGIEWVRDTRSPNGRGFYRGPGEVMRIVVSLLESAGVIRVKGEELAAPMCTEFCEPCSGIDATGIREYQREGAAWVASMLRNTGAALLADEMGLGKTAQTIRALDAVGSGCVLVVCPAVVVRHWRAQAARWGVLGAESRYWNVMSYEGFTKLAKKNALPACSFVVFDEMHYLSNPKSQRSQAAASFLAARRADRSLRGVMGLSGTPMTARPRDLWHVLELLWPGRFGKRFDFEKRYCGGHFEEVPKIEKSVWVADGCTRPDELAIRLASCMLRRSKSAAGVELPPRTRTVIEVELPAKAARDLSRAASAIDWNKPNGASISSLLSDVEAYKIDAALELARDVMASGGRPLIFTTRVATSRKIAAELQCPCVNGEDVAADDRQALLADAPVGVATMHSVTTGIDLTRYDSLIFVGLDWVPSTMLQAAARVHRLGQERSVSEYYLIGLRTLDEIVRAKVIERLDQFDQITRGNGDERAFSADLGGGSDDDLLAGFAAAVMKGAT